MKRLGTYFLQGLLFISPLAATVYIVFLLFQFTDGLLSSYLEKYFQLKVPGLGTYFLQGLLFISPLAATVYIVFLLFQFTDGLLSSYLEKYFQLKVPGLG